MAKTEAANRIGQRASEIRVSAMLPNPMKASTAGTTPTLMMNKMATIMGRSVKSSEMA